MLVPPVSAVFYELVFPCFVRVYLRVSLSNASRPIPKATGCEILLYVVLYSAMSWYISQGKQVGHELI